MTYPTLPLCQADHKGSKFIVPLHLLNIASTVDSPKPGFVKLYFKNNILTSKYSNGAEKNLVLDTVLTGLTTAVANSPIVSTDTVIIGLGKLQSTINFLLSGGFSQIQSDWAQADNLQVDYIKNKPIIPVNTSDLTNDSGYITLLDIPPIPSDIDDLTDITGIIPTDVSELSDTTGIIPAAQIQSDWNQATNTELDYIKNKPSLATVATSGSYNDLSDKPTKTTATVTIAVADWSGGTTCTKTVAGVTATTWNEFAFAESYRAKIIEFDVRPSAQGANSITFTADSTPDAEIVFNVQIEEV